MLLSIIFRNPNFGFHSYNKKLKFLHINEQYEPIQKFIMDYNMYQWLDVISIEISNIICGDIPEIDYTTRQIHNIMYQYIKSKYTHDIKFIRKNVIRILITKFHSYPIEDFTTLAHEMIDTEYKNYQYVIKDKFSVDKPDFVFIGQPFRAFDDVMNEFEQVDDSQINQISQISQISKN